MLNWLIEMSDSRGLMNVLPRLREVESDISLRYEENYRLCEKNKKRREEVREWLQELAEHDDYYNKCDEVGYKLNSSGKYWFEIALDEAREEYISLPEQFKKLADLHFWLVSLARHAHALVRLADESVSQTKAETPFQFLQELFDAYKKEQHYVKNFLERQTELEIIEQIKGMFLSKLVL